MESIPESADENIIYDHVDDDMGDWLFTAHHRISILSAEVGKERKRVHELRVCE